VEDGRRKMKAGSRKQEAGSRKQGRGRRKEEGEGKEKGRIGGTHLEGSRESTRVTVNDAFTTGGQINITTFLINCVRTAGKKKTPKS
jgi:hypothetical protein